MSKKLTGDFGDGSFTIDPSQFTSDLARVRHQQSRMRNPRNTVDVKPEHFKARCPHCHATNIVMSFIDPRLPSTVPPNKGDVIKCDVCRQHHAVTEINLNGAVKTTPFDLSLHQ